MIVIIGLYPLINPYLRCVYLSNYNHPQKESLMSKQITYFGAINDQNVPSETFRVYSDFFSLVYVEDGHELCGMHSIEVLSQLVT